MTRIQTTLRAFGFAALWSLAARWAPGAHAAEQAAPDNPPPEPADAVTPEPSGPIAAFLIKGARPDDQAKIEALLESVAARGTPFVGSGAADRVGAPIGTVPRVRQALDAVGYDAVVEVHPAPGGLALTVDLRPYDRVRYIFVRNNRRIRQDEIQRRITLRPGRPIPLPGPDRDAALDRERLRVIEYLRGEGYFDSNVHIDLHTKPELDGATDVTITVDRGPPYPVGPITISGNTAIPTEEIDRVFRHSDPWWLWTRPAPFTARTLRDDIATVVKRYRALGYVGARVTSDFSLSRSIDRKAKNVRLGIVVNERKRIAIAFEGNVRKSAGTLKDELTLFDRGAYDEYEIAASADSLQRYYQQQGFFFARVAWRREPLGENEERMVFTIDEGPQLKVRGIEFVGNTRIPGDTLREVVSVRTFPTLGSIGLGEGGYVTGRQMQGDAERIVEHYKGKGFPEVKAVAEAATAPEALGLQGAVAAAAETTSRTAKAIYVRFTIQEGPRVQLKSEDFRTNDGTPLPYDKTFLLESVSLRPGEPYTPGLVREDGKRLQRLLGDAGFPSAMVEPDVSRTGEDVQLHWVLKPGRRARVGPVFVRGNFVTRDATILQQIPLRSGDLVTTTAVERGQRNLGFMQLFNNANPITFPSNDEKRDVVPMVVNVEERYEQYSVVHLGVGASTEQSAPNSSWPGAYVRVGYENRNLLGRGWTFFSQAAYGSALFRGNMNFLDRRFLGSLFRFDIALTYLSQATVRLGDIRSGGGSIGFSREMFPGIDAGLHYNLRNTTHTEALLRSAGPDEQQRAVQLGTTVGSLSFNVEWQRLDNRLLPTRGFKLEAATEIALPALSIPLRPLPFEIGDDTFLKVAVRSTAVVPLASWVSLRHGLRFEHGFPLGGPSLLPKVERYFAGGDTTIRGFKLDRARVEVVEYPIYGTAGLTGVEYRPIGGNLRIIQNIDLQFPISPPWFGALFMDNGEVADSLHDLGPGKFRHGVGVTPLLLKLPIGDLSFAWAWPLDPGPGDTRIGVFHVNIGLLF
ncbi:MAG TPA: POTRA domain-containing protein [Polyangia bacterium]|nr:POTRA domain-containing protein [Polyangia bacterium]